MTTADRWRSLCAAFDQRVAEVTDWDAPAPCEGWVARDVVDHLVAWVPAFLRMEPAADWPAVRDAVQAVLDDPVRADAVVSSQAGDHRFEDAVAQFVLADVLVHTWDLARSNGLDERLDPDETAYFLSAMQPADEMMRGEHFGPKVAVSDDADDVTKLIAFTGRHP